MIATREIIQSFQRFALDRISATDAHLSMDELYDLWRMEQPLDDEITADVLAVEASLREMRAGNVGRALSDVINDLRHRNGCND